MNHIPHILIYYILYTIYILYVYTIYRALYLYHLLYAHADNARQAQREAEPLPSILEYLPYRSPITPLLKEPPNFVEKPSLGAQLLQAPPPQSYPPPQPGAAAYAPPAYGLGLGTRRLQKSGAIAGYILGLLLNFRYMIL